MADIDGSKPIDFTYPEGLEEAVEYCFGGEEKSDTGTITACGITIDPSKTDLKQLMLGYVRGVDWQ